MSDAAVASVRGPRAPVPAALALAKRLLAPWRRLTAPTTTGLEHVPLDRPVLLVGNHTLMGLLDVPLMLLELHDRLGLWPHPVGDHAHFAVPGWRALLAAFGTVDGTPERCHALMAAGRSLLVFPGGAREVFKRRGERYRLLWGERTGFARLAVAHRYPIVPFAAVGAEECYDILFDAGDLGRLVPPFRRLPRAQEAPPLVRGVGPTLLPRPQPFFFHFAPAIETDDAVAQGPRGPDVVRDRVRTAVEAALARLLRARDGEPAPAPVERRAAA